MSSDNSVQYKTVFVVALGVLLGATLIAAAPESLADSQNSPSSFSSIFSAISDAGRAFIGGGPAPNNEGRAGRQSRQTNTDKVVVPGFPNGLPSGAPEGVKIALASAQRGPDGEFIMSPIPGQAGVDFPVLASVPETGFDCGAQEFPGIYGDTGADCQVFYMCQPNGNFDSFLCPNGTIFNQQYFICDWWYNVDCAASVNFYALNEFIYQDQEEGKICQSLFCIDD